MLIACIASIFIVFIRIQVLQLLLGTIVVIVNGHGLGIGTRQTLTHYVALYKALIYCNSR